MDNPFNALTDQKDGNESDSGVIVAERDLQLDQLLVSMFRFAVNTGQHMTHEGKRHITCVSLAECEASGSPQLLSLNNLDQWLCERLMVADINQSLIQYPIDKQLVTDSSVNDCEQKVLHYLYDCYHKIENHFSPLITTGQKIQLRDIVINQSALIVCHPEIDPNFDDKRKISQMLELLEDYDDNIDHKTTLQAFIGRVFDRIQAKCESGDEDITPTVALKPTYDSLCERLTHTSLHDSMLSRILNVLNAMVLNENLSKALIQLCEPQTHSIPILQNLYQNSLIGLLLSISCLPRPLNPKPEFFLNPSKYSQHENENTEKSLGFQLNLLTNGFHSVIRNLLKHRKTRDQTVAWIEKCLDSFKDRSKTWTNEMIFMSGSAQNSSDGFMLNLSSVLLKLCKPFCITSSDDIKKDRLLKVDARYCRLKKSGYKPYLEAIATDSFLIPSDVNEINGDNFEVNFNTQCFVATHKALHLGFRVVHERFLKLVRDLNQMQQIYEEMNAQSTGDSEAIQNLRKRMDKQITQFLSMKTMLTESDFLETTLCFHISTSVWLSNLALNANEAEASKGLKTITLPIGHDVDSQCLKSVPEFILENVSDFVTFVKHFGAKSMALHRFDLEPLMTLIIIFMGSPERLKNPHLRAKLAEMLESLMPSTLNENHSNFSFSAYTERLFTSHPLVSELVPTLVHVFVSIEISEASGESVSFEHKFGYRKPMYIVLKYLWNNADHRKRMKEMADFAQNNMEAVVPPLFLRFINLLMNDAIFLLDEALSYMSKIKELQQQRDSGEWAQLPPQQREQNETNFQHTGRIATFHNIMGRSTINTLSWITEDIKSIFSDKTLVDRMAAMLNYFLLHLVGPDSKNLKVKDLKQYEFNPKDIVHDICAIYVNLANEDNPRYKKFCLAVGSDDRCYSANLLPLACDVLIKTGFAHLSQQTEDVATRVEIQLQFQKHLEIDMNDVPEEFMDPIMSSLMTDPVILPNSGVKVDRSTIARHLLSDQTDPFTRAPLTMDLVVADNELKQRIKEFVDQKLKDKQQTNS